MQATRNYFRTHLLIKFYRDYHKSCQKQPEHNLLEYLNGRKQKSVTVLGLLLPGTHTRPLRLAWCSIERRPSAVVECAVSTDPRTSDWQHDAIRSIIRSNRSSGPRRVPVRFFKPGRRTNHRMAQGRLLNCIIHGRHRGGFVGNELEYRFCGVLQDHTPYSLWLQVVVKKSITIFRSSVSPRALIASTGTVLCRRIPSTSIPHSILYALSTLTSLIHPRPRPTPPQAPLIGESPVYLGNNRRTSFKAVGQVVGTGVNCWVAVGTGVNCWANPRGLVG